MSVIDFTNLRDIHFGGYTLLAVRLGSDQIWPKPQTVPNQLRLAYTVNPGSLSPASTVSGIMLQRPEGTDWDEAAGPNQKVTHNGRVVAEITTTQAADPFNSEELALYKITVTNGVATGVATVPNGAIKSSTGHVVSWYDLGFAGVDAQGWQYSQSGKTVIDFTFDEKVVKAGDIYGLGVVYLQTVGIMNTFAFIHVM